jgi:formylglycine-generating enzyme required for sulfatase activity
VDPDCDRPEVEDLFQASLAIPEAGRSAFLRHAARGDAALLAAVERLLAAHARSPAVEAILAGFPDSLVPPGNGFERTRHGARERRIGRYLIRDVLGEGGMGIVYVAEQESPRRSVALKVLKRRLASPRQVRRFRGEAEILGRLQHPSIAQVFEAGTALEDGVETPFFAMELIRGLSLTRFAGERRLARDERLRLLIRVCEAVDHAHCQGIVHRDLKPANILVDGAGLPKVLDFGVARAMEADPEGSNAHTETGQLVGTIHYMSPEQFGASSSAVDPRSDVYSLGVVAYELLAGRLPYALAGKMIHEVAAIIQDQPPIPLSSLDSRLDGDLERVVHKAIAKERDERYLTARDFAEDLGRFLAGQPILARPPGLVYQAGKYVRRHKALVGGVSAFLCALLLGTIASAVFAFRESRQRRLAEVQRDEILSLADAKRAADLRAEAESLLLWPQTAGQLARVESWLGRSGELSANLGFHRARFQSLDSLATAELNVEWQRGLLSQLVSEIEDLTRPGSGPEAKLLLRLRAGRENEGAWAEAIRSIADPTECPAYAGLRLPVQDGLVPLGRDPRSGLWEFLALLPEAMPRGAGEGWQDPLAHGVVMVLLPGGTFRMGSLPDAREVDGSELPRHEVTLEPFFLSKYEVTQAQWRAVFGSAPSYFRGERLPMEHVSWEECAEFCRRLGLELPAEAQWEYACRAGTGTRYSSGETARPDDFHFLTGERLEQKEREIQPLTLPVDAFAPNAFGLHNLHGNVAEWCADFMRGQFYSDPRSRVQNPFASSWFKGWRARVVRGGGFKSPARACRSAARWYQNPRFRGSDLGLRPARSIFPPEPDALLLRDLLDRAEVLIDPGQNAETKVSDLEAWLEDAASLAGRLPEHRLRLRRREEDPAAEKDPERDRVRALVAGLEAFLDPDAGLRIRMEFLCELTRNAGELWEPARRSLADPAECPAYRGLRAVPQFGFVPSHRAGNGLWTFVHFLGFRVPPRKPDGRLDVSQLVPRREGTLHFVLLPGGEFEMGPPAPEDEARSGPRRRLALRPFLIGTHEVTQAEWQDLVGENPSRHQATCHPVTNVSGHDGLVFCQLTGLAVPTEAQWEYACRAGAATPYASGASLATEDANFDALCEARGAPYDESVARTVPAGAFAPNAFGLHNLHGNVGEWCLESENPDGYLLDAVEWVVRGGSWSSCARDCRAWSRRRAVGGFRGATNGFRPVRVWIEPPPWPQE